LVERWVFDVERLISTLFSSKITAQWFGGKEGTTYGDRGETLKTSFAFGSGTAACQWGQDWGQTPYLGEKTGGIFKERVLKCNGSERKAS